MQKEKRISTTFCNMISKSDSGLSSVSFIIGRAFAGIDFAGIYSGSFMMIADAVPLHQVYCMLGSLEGCTESHRTEAPHYSEHS